MIILTPIIGIIFKAFYISPIKIVTTTFGEIFNIFIRK